MATADAIVSEIRGCLREAAGRDHSTVERAIETAARQLDIPFSRAWSIWYGKARRIWADEADTIRAKMAEIRQANILKLRAELARLEAVDARLTRELEESSQSGVGEGESLCDPIATKAPAGSIERPRVSQRRRA